MAADPVPSPGMAEKNADTVTKPTASRCFLPVMSDPSFSAHVIARENDGSVFDRAHERGLFLQGGKVGMDNHQPAVALLAEDGEAGRVPLNDFPLARRVHRHVVAHDQKIAGTG